MNCRIKRLLSGSNRSEFSKKSLLNQIENQWIVNQIDSLSIPRFTPLLFNNDACDRGNWIATLHIKPEVNMSKQSVERTVWKTRWHKSRLIFNSRKWVCWYSSEQEMYRNGLMDDVLYGCRLTRCCICSTRRSQYRRAFSTRHHSCSSGTWKSDYNCTAITLAPSTYCKIFVY